MSRPIKAIIILLLLILIAWKYWPSDDSTSQDALVLNVAPLSDRIWISHIPTHEREKVDVFIMLGEPQFGAFSKSSAYEGDWSTFEWTLKNGLQARMLQSQKNFKLSAVVVSGPGCEPFDYCMRLKGAPRGPKKYVSMEDWVVNASELPSSGAIVKDLFFAAPQP